MKIGLEIHQRIDSHKLFCSCPPEPVEDKETDLVFIRKLHPVLSELGYIDIASRKEFEKGTQFNYNAFNESNCLVEMDEEPPHELNQDALKVALGISLHLNANIVDEIHVMRKIVIDGSNTSGFQRTAVVALNGYLNTSKGKVGIAQIALEEESAGIISKDAQISRYKLDRLGIPLVEITTEPDILDGDHLVEVAEKIGLIMRATGRVSRGIGTIRQDVNISTEQGARIEIKGAQDLKMLPTLLKEEVRRQNSLVVISALVHKKPIKLERSFIDLTTVFSNTQSKLVKSGIESGKSVIGVLLKGYGGVLGREIQAGRRYGTELSDYARLTGVKGIIHSDEDLSNYNFSDAEIKLVSSSLNFNVGDCFVLVVAEREKAGLALENVLSRAEFNGVPKETRRANPDGSTSFMRPLAGSARLYPETDIPTILVTDALTKESRSIAGSGVEETKKRLLSMLNPELAQKMLKSRHLRLFEFLVELGAPPQLVAVTLENTIISLRREGFEISDVDSALAKLFAEYGKGSFVKSAIPEVLKGVSKGKSVQETVKEGNLEKISGKDLERIVKECNNDIQEIMKKYRLNVDVEEINSLLNVHKKKKA